MKINNLVKYIIKKSVYHAMPVYNFNWIKSQVFFKKLLGDLLITVIDVGARSGSAEELEPLAPSISYIGFDADDIEVRRLNAQNSIYAKSQYFSSFVGEKKVRYLLIYIKSLVIVQFIHSQMNILSGFVEINRTQ